MPSPTSESHIVADFTAATQAPVATTQTDSTNALILNGLTTAINIARKTFDEIVKPSIRSFIETSQTNPRVAAIIATPALLAFLFTVAFLVFSTLTLVIWTIITVFFGIVFVIIGGFKALLLKLTLVFITAIPLAAVGTGLLVCGNHVAQVILRGVPASLNIGGGLPTSVDELDWQKVAEAALRNLIEWSKYIVPLLHTVLETTTTVVHTSYTCLRTTAAALHDATARGAALMTTPPPNDESAENPASTSIFTETVAPVHGDSDNELIIVEPVNISTSSATGESTPTLHQRAPFRHPNDSEGN